VRDVGDAAVMPMAEASEVRRLDHPDDIEGHPVVVEQADYLSGGTRRRTCHKATAALPSPTTSVCYTDRKTPSAF
jgi:hypothetical protein